ncbi:RHS repeat-associated core domain-containing protein [Sphaerisporangium sp. B11E5]|uniref:RHS repeat-associated core domain-containing protein n=1 Tax=Sphaerisporangium sp. B11E5 TaxID=3153563 RepID=UPI00325C76D5
MGVPAAPAAAEADRAGNAAGLLEAAGVSGGSSGGVGRASATGAYTTGYPFQVPVGHGGLTPRLGLSYSSDGPVHGTVAAGWSLTGSATITVDVAAGTVRPEWPQGGTTEAPRNFTGPNGPLVRDDSLPKSSPQAVGYRALHDASFTRFEYLAGTDSPYWWQAYGADGRVSNFGLKTQHPWSAAPLVRVAAPDGENDPAELRYVYTTVGRTTAAPAAGQPREFLLSRIEYEAPGSADPYAKVELSWGDPAYCGSPATMPAVGSRLDYRSGFPRLSGTRKLNAVTTYTKKVSGPGFDVRHEYALEYAGTDQCDGEVSPFRQLAGVRPVTHRPAVPGQSAAQFVTLPKTTFTYGQAASYVKDAHYGPANEVTNLGLPESVDTNVLSRMSHPDLFAPPGPPTTSTVPFGAIPGDGSAQLPNENGRPFYTSAWQLSAAQASGESVQQTLVDVNGDGQLDMLKRNGPAFDLSAPANAPATGGCMVDVYLNQNGQFVKQDGSNADKSKFRAFSLRRAFADIPVGTGVPDSGAGELLCAGLNRSFSPAASGWHGDASRPCSSVEDWGAPASWKSWQQVRHGLVDVTGDGKPELVAQTIASVTCPYASTDGLAPPTRSEDDDTDWKLEFHFRDSENTGQIVPVTKRSLWWWVYENTGSGFAAAPTRVRAGWARGGAAPQAMTDALARVPEMGFLGEFAARPDSQAPIKQTVASLQDVNGDGFTDLAHDGGHVVLGEKGGFTGIGDRITLPGTGQPGDDNYDLAPRMDKHSDDCDVDFEDFVGYLAGGAALDVNADGLVDRVVKVDPDGGDKCQAGQDPSAGTKVIFNTGYGFASAADDGQVMFSQNSPDTQDLRSFHTREDAYDWQGYPYAADRTGRARFTDVDGDRLPDLLFYDRTGGGRGMLYAGGGRQWVTGHVADVPVARALAGVAKVHPAGTLRQDGGGAALNEWADRGDYRHTYAKAADLNGDGLLDLLSDDDNDGKAEVRYAKKIVGSGVTAAPARLLRTMSNGKGATTTVDYLHDTAARKWVARSVNNDPGHGQPAVFTSFRYIKPVFTQGPYGRDALRGYTEVHTLGNANDTSAADDVTRVTRYDYQFLPSGVPTLSATVLGRQVNATGLTDDQPGVMSLVDHAHQMRPVGSRAPGMRADYPIYVALPERDTAYTCTGTTGQTPVACRGSGSQVRTETAWTQLTSDGAFAAFVPSVQETRFTDAEGRTEVRRAVPAFNLAWDGGTFNVAPDKTVDSILRDGEHTVLGETRYTYHDTAFRRVKTVTADPADPAVAERTAYIAYHDASAGTKRHLPAKTWAPEQYARHVESPAGFDPGVSGAFTAYDYDATGVHLTKVVNPVGHTVETVADPATGQVLDTFGPNYSCPDGTDVGTTPDPATGCTFATARGAGLVERFHTDVDGLGRPVKNTAYRIGDPGSGVELFRATYNDLAFESDTSKRVSVVTESLVGDHLDGRRQFSHNTVEVDGFGRTLRGAVVQNDSVTRVTTVAYNYQGLPAKATGPAGDGQGTVTAVYGYDGLGRPLTVGEQAGATDLRVLARQSYSYDGLTVTATQHTAVLTPTGDIDEDGDGSPASRKTITTDSIGRLVAVAEKWRPPQDDAVTRYTYDAFGTASVIDADGVTTTLSHDYFGDRRKVRRPGPDGGRVWSFGYDRNGQRVTMTEPVPGDADAADYTHHTAYDDLGRTVRFTPAVRDLDAAEQARFQAGPDHSTTYTYDTPHESLDAAAGEANHTIGRVTFTSSPAATSITTYNAFGLPTASSQRLSPGLTGQLTGLPGIGDTLAATLTYDEDGLQAKAVQHTARDGAGQATFTGPAVHAAGFDRDGAPVAVGVDLGTRGTMTIAHDRNAGGLVTARRVNTGELPGFAAPLTRYSHDRYGRLTGLQTVAFGQNGAELQRYKQTVAYLDNGQVGQTDDYLGETTDPVTTTYAYNHRGELESAMAPDYYALLGVRASGRLDFVSVADLGDPAQPVPGKRLISRNVTYRYQDPGDPATGADPLRLAGLHVDDGTQDGYDLAAYLYDEAGNTTRRTLADPVTGAPGTTYTQRWDGPSGLREVTNESSGESETYFYDGGSRIAAVSRNAQDTVTRVRRYFGAQEIVYTPGGQPEYRQNLSLAGDTIGRVDGDAGSGTLEHYTTGPQGHHVLALAAEDAATRRVTRYGAFGEVLSSFTAEANGQPAAAGKYPQEFNGKDYDPVGDLLAYGARSYDALAMQWTSADPLFLAAPDLDPANPVSANLYTFTGNNPIGRVDPTGLSDEPVGGGESLCPPDMSCAPAPPEVIYPESPAEPEAPAADPGTAECGPDEVPGCVSVGPDATGISDDPAEEEIDKSGEVSLYEDAMADYRERYDAWDTVPQKWFSHSCDCWLEGLYRDYVIDAAITAVKDGLEDGRGLRLRGPRPGGGGFRIQTGNSGGGRSGNVIPFPGAAAPKDQAKPRPANPPAGKSGNPVLDVNRETLQNEFYNAASNNRVQFNGKRYTPIVVNNTTGEIVEVGKGAWRNPMVAHGHASVVEIGQRINRDLTAGRAYVSTVHGELSAEARMNLNASLQYINQGPQ